jgi:catechol 2,3-dioxygenase-like lactoylglutathione lyase family enzyme
VTFRVAQIDHVETYVPDRYEAAAWYSRVLGLSILRDREHWAEDPLGPLMISSDDGNTKIALFEGEPTESRTGRRASGFYLLAFRVDADGFRAFLDHAEALGLQDRDGRPLNRSSAKDHGGAWSVYFSDPWGHELEVTTYETPSPS